MKNKTDLGKARLVWIAHKQFDNSWKDIENMYNKVTYLLLVDCKTFASVARIKQ
jgi:hypothetical protein